MTQPLERVPPEAPEDAATGRQRPPALKAYLELLRSHEALSTEIAQFFGERGITPQQFNVLRILADDTEAEGLRCSGISERLVNRVPDITRLLDRLEKAGLVARHRDARDRRVVRAALTAEGRALVDRTQGPLEDAFRRLFDHLDEAELDQLSSLLKKARRAEGTPR
ncbi:MAG: MarR family transcriptional regulator [Deltaproteobacteria bacterium]|nr:MarR family transcriptional regulator [Deltaproteobacteria bacterium]